ncbi:hypothetical protein Bca101_026825 [Brassica carinata]
MQNADPTDSVEITERCPDLNQRNDSDLSCASRLLVAGDTNVSHQSEPEVPQTIHEKRKEEKAAQSHMRLHSRRTPRRSARHDETHRSQYPKSRLHSPMIPHRLTEPLELTPPTTDLFLPGQNQKNPQWSPIHRLKYHDGESKVEETEQIRKRERGKESASMTIRATAGHRSKLPIRKLGLREG